jgi:hypothetical protein
MPIKNHPTDPSKVIYVKREYAEHHENLEELKQLVKSFFEDYLNYQEESDSGRVFNPIHVSCTRAMMIEPLAKLLMRMKELSGVRE